jgi:histidine triad (HIT) family protein
MPVAALGPYDPNNVFARILRHEIPSQRVYEDPFAIAFHDLNPQAPVHVLVIPRGAYVSWADFSAQASDAEIAGFVRAVGAVARQLGLDATASLRTPGFMRIKRCRTSTFTSSAASRWGRCCRAREIISACGEVRDCRAGSRPHLGRQGATCPRPRGERREAAPAINAVLHPARRGSLRG